MPDRTTEIVKEMQIISNAEYSQRLRINPSVVEFPDLSKPPKDRYAEVVAWAKIIFKERNSYYGNAFEDTGVLGAVVAMVGDYGRLKNMVLRNPDHGRQHQKEVKDKLLDILNQCVIGIMCLEDENWEGK